MIRAQFAAAIVALMVAPFAFAGPCKDAKGKFTKCPVVSAPAQRCKAANGKSAKCGTPGAKPT